MDEELLLKTIKKDCLRLLTRREHSRKEIEQKLSAKGYQPAQFSVVLDELTKQSWQDDSRFAESYINMRSKKGFGPVRIAHELNQQGIEKQKVERLLANDAFDWPALLQQVYCKKFPDSVIADNAERGRRFRFLAQRGFPSSMIIDVLEQTSKKAT